MPGDSTGTNFDFGSAILKPQAGAQPDQFITSTQGMTVREVQVRGYTDSEFVCV